MLSRSRTLFISLKPPSFNSILDRFAPVHLRGIHVAQDRLAREADELARKEEEEKALKAKLRNVQVQSSSEERGFMKASPSSSRSRVSQVMMQQQQQQESDNNKNKSTSANKYAVQWSDELDGTTKPSGGLEMKIGSNLSRTKWQQAAKQEASASGTSGETADDESDVLLNTLKGGGKKKHTAAAGSRFHAGSSRDSSSTKTNSKIGGAKTTTTTTTTSPLDATTGGGVEADDASSAKKKQPGVLRKFWNTYGMRAEDTSAIRDQDGSGSAASYEELSDEKLQTGKYFQKLHAASLKSWTRQCFVRLDELEGMKLISVEVETEHDTDIVTVFVCAEGLDDKNLEKVKKWVDNICPVTKARNKMISQMEDEDRRNASHVLAPKSRMAKPEPLRQFAKRKQIRWIRVDPDA